MAISITYGPISAALQLAQRSGEGEDWWKRYSAGQQALDRVDRQTDQALRLRGMIDQEEARDISTAMNYQAMQQRDRIAAEEGQRRNAELAASTALQQDKATQQMELRRAFQERFGAEPEMFEAGLKQQAEERLTKAAEGTAADRAARMILAPQHAEMRNAADHLARVENFAANVAKDIMATGAEKAAAAQQVAQARAALQAAYQGYQGQASGLLPQYGQATGAPGPQQAPPPVMDQGQAQRQAAQLLQQIPGPVRRQVEQGIPVEQINFPDGLNPQQLAEMEQAIRFIYQVAGA